MLLLLNFVVDANILVIVDNHRFREVPPAFSPPITSRFEKRLYVSLPDATAHRQLINAFLERMPNNITAEDVEEIVEGTKGKKVLDFLAAADPSVGL